MPTSPHPGVRFRGARLLLALALCSAALGVGPLTFSHTAAASGWAVIASPNVSNSVSNELQDVAMAWSASPAASRTTAGRSADMSPTLRR